MTGLEPEREGQATGEPVAEHCAESHRVSVQIGKYKVVKLLGKGAMGAVYRAHDPLLERDVALKVMLPQFADDLEQKARFEREGRAAARLVHPNVVTIFDLGYHTDGSPYIVMELLRGLDLLQTMQSGPPLTLDSKIEIVLQVLAGLNHAHLAGVVHRDIKPANLFITDEGLAKIMDFGVARLNSGSVTAAGVVLGTANYMSPEQVVGGPLDARSDLFSVASLLCELVFGRRPFIGDNVLGTLYKIAYEEPSFPSAEPECEALIPILRRSLSKHAHERHGSAAEFAAELQSFLDRRRSGSHDRRMRSGTDGGSKHGLVARALDNRQDAPHSTALGSGATPAMAALRPGGDSHEIFRLIRDVYVAGKSGDIHWVHGSERRSLRVRKGQIINGRCDVQGEDMGDVAVRYGLLSHADLDAALALVLREGKRLGPVLCEMGLLDRERVEEAVTLHVREILFRVLERGQGSQRFEELAEGQLNAEIACRLSSGDLILEATRRIPDPSFIREALGDLDRIPELATNALLRTQHLMLTPADGFVLSRIDGQLSAREVLGLIPLSSEEAERSLFGLICTGTVDYRFGPPRSRSSLLVSGAVPLRAAPSPSPTARSGPSPRPAYEQPRGSQSAEPPEDPTERRRMIMTALDGLLEKNYFEVLGITSAATDVEVRAAYARLVRLLHPDACRGSVFDDIREQVQPLFFRACEAYEALSSAVSRAAYERRLSSKKSAERPRPLARSALAQEPPASPTSGNTAAVPVAARQSSRAVGDHVPGIIDVGESVRSAEGLIGQQKYWDAIQHLEKLIPMTHGRLRARASVALARAYAKNPKWTKRADDLLQSVVRESPDFVPAYLALGALYRAGKFVNRAIAMYSKALELDPTRAEAREELTALNRERSRPDRGRR
jgi:serine/threonine-protein kinase